MLTDCCTGNGLEVKETKTDKIKSKKAGKKIDD